MKALVQNNYGPAESLQIEDVEKPKAKKGEAIVYVKATSLNAPDWRLLKGKPLMMRLATGLFHPKNKIKGSDFSGIIETPSHEDSDFQVGDAVIGDLSDADFGAFADYVCVKTSNLAKKPYTLSHLEAAALPLTSVTAYQAIRKLGQLNSGERVLIIGASGGVGSYAIQLSRYYGGIVTAVTSERSKSQALDLGADQVIDYNKTPLESLETSYDLIVAINGFYALKTYKKLLRPQGRLVMVGGKSMGQIMLITIFGKLLSKKNGKQYKGLLAQGNGQDLSFISSLVDDKALRPVIEKSMAFEDLPKGLSELEKGHVKGKIVAWVNKDS